MLGNKQRYRQSRGSIRVAGFYLSIHPHYSLPITLLFIAGGNSQLGISAEFNFFRIILYYSLKYLYGAGEILFYEIQPANLKFSVFDYLTVRILAYKILVSINCLLKIF